MTGLVRDGAEALSRCHRVARTEGLAHALSVLQSAVLPGMLPCGPGGHAVVPVDVAASARQVWRAGVVSDRSSADEAILLTAALPDGGVVALRLRADPTGTFDGCAEDGMTWALGLLWLRLGSSEGLLDACTAYLGERHTGESSLLHQQMVQGAIAEVLIDHLEIRAVLADAHPGHLSPATLADLHDRITWADRALLRLLGASGFVAGGPGQVAQISEILAEVHTGVPERKRVRQ